MKPIDFPGVNVRVAEKQPQYETIPAYVGPMPVAPKPGGCPLCGMPKASAMSAYYICGSSNYDPEKGTVEQGDLCQPTTAKSVTACYQLDPDEIAEVVATGHLWISVLTFGQPLQPLRLSVRRPDFCLDICFGFVKHQGA